MSNRGVTGTSEWARYQIELPVAANARNINFGALHTGDGSAWFDGLTIELLLTELVVSDNSIDVAAIQLAFTG